MNKKYELAVIGAGASGMMAAGRAAEKGVKVILLEKNKQPGIKILISGKGRCNLTNTVVEIAQLINVYGRNGKFLYPALNNFSNKDTIDFFEGHNLPLKNERGGRVFPKSDKAKDVVSCLKNYLLNAGVDLRTECTVKELTLNKGKNRILSIILESGEKIFADNYLIATGGKSFPGTGSTGDGYKWLKQLGHTIIAPKPALVPILIKEQFVEQLNGLNLKNIELSLWQQKKLASMFGEAVFIGNELSGPLALNLSNQIREIGPKDLKIKLDFKPALDHSVLDKRILKDFEELKNKNFSNSLNKLLPKQLIPVIIELSGIDENKKVSEISKNERKRIVRLLKEFELTVDGLAGFDKAIVTSGGLSLKEVDPKTMKSKLIDNLYLAGEILDLDGPTGGYNLQVAWSTGYLLADNISVK